MRKLHLLLRAPLLVGFALALLPAFAQEPVPPPASPAPPQSHRMPVARKFSYACDCNVTVDVALRGERARVVVKDKTYSMKHVKSGSGARYAEGSVVWWNKGYDGFLQDESDPNHPVMLAENCRQTSPTPNSGAAAHAVSGTVAYRERIAMPENALLTIQLQDTSRADAPVQVVAQQEITFARRQVPLPFELTYEPAKIDPQHTYSVSARITVDGQLRFLNTSAYRVLTQGHPANVNLILQSVPPTAK
jgi:putative lipoprotein